MKDKFDALDALLMFLEVPTKYETLNFLKNNPSKLTERKAARIRIDTTEKARSTYWNSIPF